MNKKKIILSIAGSDNTSGAGVQADIKTCQLLGAFCLNVITVITSQSSDKMNDMELVSLKLIKSKVFSIFNEYKVDAIKIGLLCDLKVAKFIKNFLIKKSIRCPLVIDPVFCSTTGKIFYKKDKYKNLFKIFSPLKPVFTPNYDEIKQLFNKKNKNDLVESNLKALYLKYKTPFVLTGIKKNKKEICDYLIQDNKISEFKSLLVKTKNTHGTGCVFSTSLSIHLAKGFSLENSVKRSKKFLFESLKKSPNLGVSYGPLI
ncbi:MAG: hypothetical protein CL572_04720 [Alphaproteobacteria bacterium]|nr:hypothetical protein [Alphaproteobacteria bacterium]|tara:strand:+ start:983 stop:1759 length:777 start_codon:yes stop_codon:yes gene_type:complete